MSGVLLGHFAADEQEQPVADLQDIRLVENGDVPAPLPRQFESLMRNPFTAVPGDTPQGNRDIRGHQQISVTEFHVAVGVEALGIFADDHKVEIAGFRRQPGIGA